MFWALGARVQAMAAKRPLKVAMLQILTHLRLGMPLNVKEIYVMLLPKLRRNGAKRFLLENSSPAIMLTCCPDVFRNQITVPWEFHLQEKYVDSEADLPGDDFWVQTSKKICRIWGLTWNEWGCVLYPTGLNKNCIYRSNLLETYKTVFLLCRNNMARQFKQGIASLLPLTFFLFAFKHLKQELLPKKKQG